MQIEWQVATAGLWQADAAIFFLFEESEDQPSGFKRFLADCGNWISHSAALKDFHGKPNEVSVIYAPGGEAGIVRVILAGLGPAGQFEMDKMRSSSAFALRKCRELGIERPAIPVSAFEGICSDISACLRESLIGAVAGLHRFSELKTQNAETSSGSELILLLSETQPDAELKEVVTAALAQSAGIILGRDLTVSPSNRVTPKFLADTASALAREFDFRIETIDVDSARSLGMGAFAAVARGSREPAFVIVIEHAPAGTESDAPLVFIGKGITFDTGGISLKSSDKLDAMKQDMAGAASVLGAMEIIGRTALRRRVIGILPCSENMPGGQAYKPGDVVRSYSGQTVEIISTDAEGRLVLCDAISYAAKKFKPALMVDIATLTGACVVALGNYAAAVLGNREELVRSIQEFGAAVGERFWPMPLWDSYFETLKSDVADMKNVGERAGGAIVAAIFLKQFVPQEIPWAHLDIAGTAWTDKDTGIAPKGATGFGVRTLFEIARRWPELSLEEDK
jgi:leucyl aminopeptidase